MTEYLKKMVEDYSTKKQPSLIQMKKGVLSREAFLKEAGDYAELSYGLTGEQAKELVKLFEQYIFGYSRISPLIDDEEISDIRIICYDNIRIKRKGRRMAAPVTFESEKEYRQFVDYVATKNQVNISNLNAIQRFTDGFPSGFYLTVYHLHAFGKYLWGTLFVYPEGTQKFSGYS
ncbi:MAG: hypothetical protein IKL22_06145 [Lachnospiraceae bacterium]|nr:hypothetical protein [Lachnospiraceae bacterium]